MPARFPRLACLAAATALLVACVPIPPEDPGPPRSSSSASVPDPTSSSVPGQQEDGTMTVAEFEGDVAAAVAVAEEYWGARFQAAGQRFVPIRRIVPYQREGQVACGGQDVPRNNAAYCGAGDFIAYDVNWAVRAFRQVGDAFLFYLLGHEYAHGIQARLGITHTYGVDHELQADCMAGAYIGDSVRSGALRLADGDLDELRQGLFAVADDPGQPWFAPDAHGTARQRTDSFFDGYEGSLAACDLG